MRARVVTVAVSGLLLMAAHTVWTGWERRRIVTDLSAAERDTLYRNTLQNYRAICVGRPADAFQHYCDEQRDLLRLFPECDTGCASVIAKSERVPTR